MSLKITNLRLQRYLPGTYELMGDRGSLLQMSTALCSVGYFLIDPGAGAWI